MISQYLIVAENITYKNNKLSCINIMDNFIALAMPAELLFDMVVICGPNWTPGEHKIFIKAKTNKEDVVSIGDATVNIPSENFVYNAVAPNLRITVDSSVTDITFLVYDGDENLVIERKYVVNSILVPSNPEPAEA